MVGARTTYDDQLLTHSRLLYASVSQEPKAYATTQILAALTYRCNRLLPKFDLRCSYVASPAVGSFPSSTQQQVPAQIQPTMDNKLLRF
ncbi:hypothetical protein CY34DRAFT_814553 [Suillus luteus UH-Slu-Lm8-n1]|uniref:Uncharacterized protein n=1 Tax=Suillus luteus UH-Slu-Lm8-n1 TaxID=930992 RepID=A0A0C9Z2J1_9AGAM|nr:hypothetical protein CY34DRAFT_814553 [Suillus luteus UH-Slu-Lm8-n1]